jgi:hypothetical protein
LAVSAVFSSHRRETPSRPTTAKFLDGSNAAQEKNREGKRREGKGREGKGREGKGREGKGSGGRGRLAQV